MEEIMAFFGWVVHYLIMFVVLVAVAGLGIFAGKKWKDSSDAKKAAGLSDTKE